MRDDIQFIQQSVPDKHNFITGDTIRLTTANLQHEYQLDVVILRHANRLIYGSVLVISPKTDIPANRWEIVRGDEVVFQQENIARVVSGNRS